MARTALTVQTPTVAGVTLSFSAAGSDGHYFANDGHTMLYVKNGGTGSITCTFQTPALLGGVAVADPTVAVSNASEKVVGPFDPIAFAQSDGSVYVDFSGVSTVTVAAIRV